MKPKTFCKSRQDVDKYPRQLSLFYPLIVDASCLCLLGYWYRGRWRVLLLCSGSGQSWAGSGGDEALHAACLLWVSLYPKSCPVMASSGLCDVITSHSPCHYDIIIIMMPCPHNESRQNSSTRRKHKVYLDYGCQVTRWRTVCSDAEIGAMRGRLKNWVSPDVIFT